MYGSFSSRIFRTAFLGVILGLQAISSANAAVVWLGEEHNRIVDASGNYVDQFYISGGGSLYGGMTTVGNEQ